MGICVGMQVLAQTGLENGHHIGIGTAQRFLLPAGTCKRPTANCRTSAGMNFYFDAQEPLFAGLNRKDHCVYFVHSYALVCNDSADVIATCDYGGRIFAAAIRKDNLFAVQFHPEKSQENGLRILNWQIGCWVFGIQVYAEGHKRASPKP